MRLIDRRINRPCTIVRRLPGTTTNEYGAEVPATETVETVCELQQRRRAEAEGDLSQTEWIAYFLPTETIGTGDEVTIEPEGDFEVIGEPWLARSPRTQRDHHIEATLKQTRGAHDGEGS